MVRLAHVGICLLILDAVAFAESGPIEFHRPIHVFAPQRSLPQLPSAGDESVSEQSATVPAWSSSPFVPDDVPPISLPAPPLTGPGVDQGEESLPVPPVPPEDLSHATPIPAGPAAIPSMGPADIKFSSLPIRSRFEDRALLYREDDDELQVLPRGSSGMGLTTLGFYFGSLPKEEKPANLWFDPRFEWNLVNGPLQPDIPSQLYELSLGVNLTAAFRERWTAHLHLAPTWASDWNNKSSDAFRIIGGGIVVYEVSTNWKLAGGAMILDRPDLPVLPHAGVLWRPDDDIEVDVAIPRPRVALRINPDDETQFWLYVAGDVGGGSWAYERPDQFKDRLGYFDMRLLVGIDRRDKKGTRGVFEAGYVFHRRLNLDRADRTFDLPGTAVIRWASLY